MHISLKLRLARWIAIPVLSAAFLSLPSFTAPALAIPEGRVYELVSPVYKGGYGAETIEAVSPDGENVAFFSQGAFAGGPGVLATAVSSVNYLARRGGSGWSTTPLLPPDALTSFVSARAEVSPTLESELVLAKPGPNHEASERGTQAEFLLRSTAMPDLSADWELAGGMLLEGLIPEVNFGLVDEGASSDFCHLLFRNGSLMGAALLSKAEGTTAQLYELARGCNGEPVELRLVGLNNEGKVISPSCPVHAGGDGVGTDSRLFNDVTAEGSEIFFTTCLSNGSSDRQLFVRLAGARTLEVSKPVSEAQTCGRKIPCTGAPGRSNAEFMGASEDGSKVFFMAAQPLVPGDDDSSQNLYMASVGCPPAEEGCEVAQRQVTSLVRVSGGLPAGEAAEVQGVVSVAPDGSHVYFTARGMLSGANVEGDAPQKGADNLYVYNSVTQSVAFIGDLCSGHELSGTVEDVHCPNETGDDASDLWDGASSAAQSAGTNGGFLVFSTYAQLVANDTNNAKDVYRYDAATGTLERVSVGEDGYDANGNRDDGNEPGTETIADATIHFTYTSTSFVIDQYNLNSRAISEDGSRIVFTSAEPLSPNAVNGLANAYEWHEGKVSLVSTGSAEVPVEEVVISGTGGDVFFVTSQGLVPQDADGLDDVYDARLGGGFPSGAAGEEECSGDACQGPLTNPAPLLVPGSVAQAPGANFAAPAPAPAATPKAKPVTCKRGLVKKKGRCVKPKKAKKAKKSSRDRRAK